MKKTWTLGCLALISIYPLASATADEKGSSVAGDTGITREQADAILKELRQIRLLLENQQKTPQAAAPSQPAMEPAKLKIGEGPFLGRADAPLTLVEFSDYQCPFCKQFHTATFEQLRKEYVDKGKLRFISRDLPLEMHQNATQAAQAARCGGEQGQFWKMRDVLIANAGNLALDALLNYAESLYLDTAKFRDCLESQKYKADVQKDLDQANALGIVATPAFVIGKTTAEGVDGFKFVGALPYATFDAKLKELLTDPGQNSRQAH
jgi:protein-disulfide isomerase